MDKLLKLLGVEKLDESGQEQLRERLETLIQVKAKELSDKTLKEEKDKLVEIYEAKFEEYKEDITSKFSNFVDSILDEELTIPEKILEYSRKGELYHDLIEQFKIRLSVDEGLLDEEVKGLLKEAKSEIEDLRIKLNEEMSKGLDLMKDAQEMAAEIYLRKKCDGLTEAQKNKVIAMLEGVFDKSEIDRKFDIIIEANDEDEDEDKKKKEDEDEDEDKKKKEDEEEENESKIEVKDNELNEDNKEDDSPFGEAKKEWLKVLKEGKI